MNVIENPPREINHKTRTNLWTGAHCHKQLGSRQSVSGKAWNLLCYQTRPGGFLYGVAIGGQARWRCCYPYRARLHRYSTHQQVSTRNTYQLAKCCFGRRSASYLCLTQGLIIRVLTCLSIYILQGTQEWRRREGRPKGDRKLPLVIWEVVGSQVQVYN